MRLRYRSQAAGVHGVEEHGRGRVTLHLAEPVDGAAPGQTACLYAGDVVVGYGTIALSPGPARQLDPGRRVTMLAAALAHHVALDAAAAAAVQRQARRAVGRVVAVAPLHELVQRGGELAALAR